MSMVALSIDNSYWEKFELQDEDIEFLYNHLLELETPLTPQELVTALVEERVRRERLHLEQERTSGGDIYQPMGRFTLGQSLIFPALNWQRGRVLSVRPGMNPDIGDFQVISVALDDGSQRDFAAGLAEHILNAPVRVTVDDSAFDPLAILHQYGEDLVQRMEADLSEQPDFVRIAGRWFPRALLIDINVGHLNLAEAVLDMAGGGPLSTPALIEQIELPADVNPKLVDFSLDLALQEDARFDEVGPAGKTLWYLRRLEPQHVLETPLYLRYSPVDYDRSFLTPEMLILERELDDDLTPATEKTPPVDQVELRLIFPHWQAGTLPLSARMRRLFPTAYEAPRILFTLVDGTSGEKFPAWVVREKGYVFGLKDWYKAHSVLPGSLVRVRRGDLPGEVIVQTDKRRPSREWVRTVLVGSDGGVVFALLKQPVASVYDDRMTIAVPDVEGVEQLWTRTQKERVPFERVVVNTVRELAKLNPQSHVHASELYAAVNVVRRCPPGPILALLLTRPGFVHLGDLHFRFNDADEAL